MISRNDKAKIQIFAKTQLRHYQEKIKRPYKDQEPTPLHGLGCIKNDITGIGYKDYII